MPEEAARAFSACASTSLVQSKQHGKIQSCGREKSARTAGKQNATSRMRALGIDVAFQKVVSRTRREIVSEPDASPYSASTTCVSVGDSSLYVESKCHLEG